MRSMWKGAVSFGLVMIPVRLYTATEQKDIAFRQVHREDGGRIRFRRFCTLDDQEVPYEDIAKGYELPDGQVIVLTEEDMADLPLPTTKNVEVVQFCPADQLDPILFNKSYYVEPEAAGTRAYSLLRDALEESGKIAIAQVALRQRESLAILRVRDGVIVLETLLWPDEVRTPDFGFLDEDIEVRPQELRMAESLIESMTVDFDPDEYHDSYREAVLELVAAKTEGREVLQIEAPPTDTGDTSSLADALRASLAAAKGGRLGAVPDQREAADAEEEAPAGRGRASGQQAAAGRATTKPSATKTSAARTGTARSAAAKPAGAKPAGGKAAAAKPKTAAGSKTSTARGKAAKDEETAARPRKRAG
ncbi:MAG TPA: Ku protein [Streptosporangiaceae bacterium]|nr:Ku protein [Streptosporangiaceae bacterium]